MKYLKKFENEEKFKIDDIVVIIKNNSVLYGSIGIIYDISNTNALIKMLDYDFSTSKSFECLRHATPKEKEEYQFKNDTNKYNL